MILGFSTGCLYKTHNSLAKETFDVFRKTGCNAIEITCRGIDSISKLSDITTEDLKGFEYISLHAPDFGDISEEKLEEALRQIEDAHRKLDFKYIVIHPDKIKNWKIFSKFSIPFAIENMDNRKESNRDVDDLKKVFEQIDAKMVLDLNHCFVNDNSMKLANDFVETFGNRIVEIHLSGFDWLHEPLYRTQQKEILNAVFDKNLPIIIESGCETVEDVEKEYRYVKNYLK